MKKKILFGSYDAAGFNGGICPGQRYRWNYGSYQHGHFVFRSRHQADLRHRCRYRPYRRRESLFQVLVRRPGHLKDCRQLVRCVYLSDCRCHHLTLILPVIWRNSMSTRGSGAARSSRDSRASTCSSLQEDCSRCS